MAKKNVTAVVKIQIPAGQASPAPPVGTALGPHGVAIMDFCKAYNARDRVPARHRGARRDLDLRGPELQLHHQDPAGPGDDPRGDQGSPRAPRTRGVTRQAPSPRPSSPRSPRSRCRTSTPTISRPPSSRSPVPPVPWASGSSTELSGVPDDRRSGVRIRCRDTDPYARTERIRRLGVPQPGRTSPGRSTDEGEHPERGSDMAQGKKYSDATKRFDREHEHTAGGGARSGQEPCLGRSSTRPSSWSYGWVLIPARPTRWCVAPLALPVRHRQGRAHRGLRPGRCRDRGHRGRSRHRRVPRTWRSRSRAGMLDFDLAIATPI